MPKSFIPDSPTTTPRVPSSFVPDTAPQPRANIPTISGNPIKQVAKTYATGGIPGVIASAAKSKTLRTKMKAGAEKTVDVLGLRGTVEYLGNEGARIANATSALRRDTTAAQALDRSQYIPKSNLKQAAGAGFQLGSVAAGGISSGAAPLIRGVAGAAASGAAALGGKAAAENKDSKTIAKQTAAGAAIGAVAETGARALQGAAQTAYRVTIPKGKREAIMLQNYRADRPFLQRVNDAVMGASKAPRIVADTAFDKGITGTETMMGVQAKRAQKQIWQDIVKPQLESAADQVDMPAFFGEARQAIIKGNADPTRRKALLTALDAITEDFADKPRAAYAELQDFKEGWAKFVPEKVYRGENISGALNDVRNSLADLARQKIYALSPDPAFRQAYIDYGNLKNLAALGQKAMTNAGLKGGTGQLLSSVLERTIVPIATVAGQVVYKAGRGIELIGRPGLNTLGDFVESLTSEGQKTPSPEPTGAQLPPKQSTYPQANIPRTRVNEDGSITTRGPLSGKEFTLDVGGIGATTKAATAGLKGAQTYAKEAAAFLKKEPPSAFIEELRSFLRYSDFKELPKGEADARKYVLGIRKGFEEYGYKDLTDTKLMRLAHAIVELADKTPKGLKIRNPFGGIIKK